MEVKVFGLLSKAARPLPRVGMDLRMWRRDIGRGM